MSECVTQYSVVFVQLGSIDEMCTWQSMKPGTTVAPDRSITRAPAGDLKPSSTAMILSS